MQFRAKTEHPTATATTEPLAASNQRKALAEAIEAANQAEDGLKAIVAAEQSAFDRECEAEDRLEAIRRRHESEPDPGADAFITSLASGSDCSVDVLQAPAQARAAEIEAAQREIDALDQVRRQIVARVEPAERVVEAAKGKVEKAAAVVLGDAIDTQRFLRETLVVEAEIIERRCVLFHLMKVLPDGPDREAAAAFIARPWLLHELHGQWKDHPALTPLKDALKRLCADSEAKIDIGAP
jgi:hypothetical protein